MQSQDKNFVFESNIQQEYNTPFIKQSKQSINCTEKYYGETKKKVKHQNDSSEMYEMNNWYFPNKQSSSFPEQEDNFLLIDQQDNLDSYYQSLEKRCSSNSNYKNNYSSTRLFCQDSANQEEQIYSTYNNQNFCQEFQDEEMRNIFNNDNGINNSGSMNNFQNNSGQFYEVSQQPIESEVNELLDTTLSKQSIPNITSKKKRKYEQKDNKQIKQKNIPMMIGDHCYTFLNMQDSQYQEQAPIEKFMGKKLNQKSKKYNISDFQQLFEDVQSYPKLKSLLLEFFQRRLPLIIFTSDRLSVDFPTYLEKIDRFIHGLEDPKSFTRLT